MSLFKSTKKRNQTNDAGRVERRSSDGAVEPRRLCKAYDFLARDPNYLLRLCQKSKWKSIKRCCEIIKGVFEKNPSVFDSLSNKARQQFLQTDAWGNTPLHIICYDTPPLAAVVALLEASRLAPGNPIQLLTMTNSKGSTPLAISCKAGAAPRIIKMMVTDGTEVMIPDKSGSSVFDALINRYSLIQRVPSMRKHYIGLTDITSKDDLVHVEDLVQQSGLQECTMSTSGKLNDLMYSISIGSTRSDASAFPYFWRIMEYLMQAAWKSQHAHGGSPIDIEYISHLHGAALIADVLPTEISDMILRTYTTADNRQEKEEEKTQTKPLHLALSRPISPHPKARLQHAHMVKQLIARDPSVVRSNMPGTGNRSVFCQAIAMGNHWNVDGGGGDDKKAPGGTNSTREGPVKLLFRGCPDGVSQRDCETGLYPFMLAATTRITAKAACEKVDQDEKARDHCDRLQLDTIYNLLRTSPECIQG